MPYRDGNPLVYDSGDFPAALEAALDGRRLRRLPRASSRRCASAASTAASGISGYVEGTAIGPYEGARVKIDLAGRVIVATGAVNSGQGHETSFAQVAADALGVPHRLGHRHRRRHRGGAVRRRHVRQPQRRHRGQLDRRRRARRCASKLVTRAAAALLEAARGRRRDRGRPGVRARRAAAPPSPSARVVQAADPDLRRAGRGVPDFEASAYHHVPTVTYASAVHVAQVEVDPGTGHVKLLRYVVAHDCGKVINPLIVEGQVHGGVAQGVGGALFEEMVYDDEGQLLTGTLHGLPGAHARWTCRRSRRVHLEYPSPRNPLGIKGLGEGGAISPPAAIANAIDDALAPFGIRITGTPALPSRIRRLIEERSQAPSGTGHPRL